MSKRNNEGEVLSNRVAVGLAQRPPLLLSLLGGNAPAVEESHDEQPPSVSQNALSDLKADGGDDEQFGIGAIVPKEIQDGSFTNRIPSSYEKLLEKIVGKKLAKAHMAAKQNHGSAAKPSKAVRPAEMKEESDEDEGRAAAFKSKRQKRVKVVRAGRENSDDEDEESRAAQVVAKKQTSREQEPDAVNEDVVVANEPDDDSEAPAKSAPISHVQKAKPKSYLDEILGEKSKKKKKKKKKGKGDSTKNDD
ncbi:hypothetical protein BU23DRAFT_256364 [Bimuria novae-zelandiae CBS 107.79]|uniref:Uncharacterized protein n=1 Tax=Bimuria novae-zelandiae CBS 107.79 TaxID=1447943 RepID=A0A6A5UUC6_9PLEO|nr:hypothetical protein BU23DRAFT_256364 [Bimuria novae-zelandiae CBS 107.79]